MSFELPPSLLCVTALKLLSCLSFNIVMLQCRGCFNGSDFQFYPGVKDASSFPSHLEGGRFVFWTEDPSMFTSTECICPVRIVNAFLVFNCAICGL